MLFERKRKHKREACVRKRRLIIISCLLLGLMVSSCSNSEKEQVESIRNNMDSFEIVRKRIEEKYLLLLSDSTRPRITFVDYKKEDRLSPKDYICAEGWLIERMDKLDLNEISFESPQEKCSSNIIFG